MSHEPRSVGGRAYGQFRYGLDTCAKVPRLLNSSLRAVETFESCNEFKQRMPNTANRTLNKATKARSRDWEHSRPQDLIRGQWRHWSTKQNRNLIAALRDVASTLVRGLVRVCKNFQIAQVNRSCTFNTSSQRFKTVNRLL